MGDRNRQRIRQITRTLKDGEKIIVDKGICIQKLRGACEVRHVGDSLEIQAITLTLLRMLIPENIDNPPRTSDK